MYNCLQLVDLTALDNNNERAIYVYMFQALRLLRLVRLFLFIKVSAFNTSVAIALAA